MSEWKRIFSHRNRRFVLLCIPLLCLALFFYQKSGGDPGNLIPQAREYQALVEEYRQTPPEEIVQALSGRWNLTEGEARLLTQAEHLAEYPGYLERVAEQAGKLQATGLFGARRNTFVYRNIVKTAADFAACSGLEVSLGNDRAVEDWLSFSLADWGMLAAVLLLVMAFQEERGKGLRAIVRACPGGRSRLQGVRLVVLAGYCAGFTLLLYALPLALSLMLDGGWGDLARPVQSLAQFQACTARLSIAGFLLLFLLVRAASAYLLGVLLWFLLSFLEQVQLCWLFTAAGLGAEYLLYTLIPPQSLFSPLRYLNVFSYVFPAQLYTQYENINFFSFPVGHRPLLLALLAVAALGLSAALMWALPRRYPFGNRDRLGRWLKLWNRVGDALRRHLGLLGLEWYKLLFLSAGGLFILLGLALTWEVPCSSGAYDRAEDLVYRQYMAQIQGPVTQDTYDYLARARQALGTAGMDAGTFEAALDRVEEELAALDNGDWLVDDTQFLNIYGADSWRVGRRNALLAVLILTACLSPLFALEQGGDVRRLLRACPGGRGKLFRTKYAVALGVTALVWLLVFAREWHGAVQLLGETVLSAPAGSVEMLDGLPGTVGSTLILLYLWKGAALLIPTHLCLFLGERGGSFELAFLLGGLVLLAPAVVYALGGNALAALTPASFLADDALVLSGCHILPVLSVWAAGSLLAMLTARRRWVRTA